MTTTRAPERKFWFVFNLLTIIVLGVSSLLWVLLYTNRFEVIGGLLGLGGAFAWIAFSANIIHQDRKVWMQEVFDKKVLQQPASFALVLALWLLFVGLGPARHASILIDASSDSSHRIIEIFEIDSEGKLIVPALGSRLIPPYQTLRLTVPTGFLASASVRIKAEGLPSADLTMGAMNRDVVRVPGFFSKRTLLLARAEADDSGNMPAFNATLTVLLNGTELDRIDDYQGDAIWVGAGRDVPVPSKIQQRWLSKVPFAGRKAVAADWFPPISIAPGLTLTVGDIIEFRIQGDTGQLLSKTRTTVVATTADSRIIEVELSEIRS